uniref:Pentatricopeptide repeat-containing protein At5g50390, chloroplastic n=1 Tax=Anthurium amnicola TaxID=1678845 RepID=A0A1D1YSR8_9ARAE
MVFRHMLETGFEFDLYMMNRVLLMHVKRGMIVDARRLFDEIPQRNVVSWNTMISGLVDAGVYEDAFRLFLLMRDEQDDANARTFASALRASAGLGVAFYGRQVHTCAVKMALSTDIFISSALIDMYCKCGCIREARSVFDEISEKTIVGWNTIIAGYALHGYSEEALDLYYEMCDSGVKMDHFTYSIIIRICSRLASLEHAKQAHAGLVRNGFGLDIVANTALVDFYCKWGRMEDARNVFDKMPKKNVISWNALIAGYAHHGRGSEAVDMFEKMLKEGMIPNHVTFLAVLGACSYSGLLDKGWEIFESMTNNHKIKPRAMHYACMVELLGREGLLDDAFALIRKAPFSPTANMWAALLTACRVHKNLELGKLAAEKLYGMEAEKLSNYIVLLNIYYSTGRSAEAAKVLETLRKRGLRLLPACSWIEIKKQPYRFLFADKSHAQSGEIYRRLDALMEMIIELGYSPNEKSLLPDVGEHEERMPRYHSEKLAIAFGLISTVAGTPLQVVQGHRICQDCHSVIKLIAKVTRRYIVIRDASRFHHFRDGVCSCGDYW